MTLVNNVTRFLDAKKVKYRAYETPVEKLGALETARFLNIPDAQVFKTIVLVRQNPGKPILGVIPGPNQVDLKLVATVLKEKKITIPTEREAEKLTGLQAGGISPLALINKGFQVIIDNSAQSFTEINVSAGQRGLNIALSPTALAELTRAQFAHISDSSSNHMED